MQQSRPEDDPPPPSASTLALLFRQRGLVVLAGIGIRSTTIDPERTYYGLRTRPKPSTMS